MIIENVVVLGLSKSGVHDKCADGYFVLVGNASGHVYLTVGFEFWNILDLKNVSEILDMLGLGKVTFRNVLEI